MIHVYTDISHHYQERKQSYGVVIRKGWEVRGFSNKFRVFVRTTNNAEFRGIVNALALVKKHYPNETKMVVYCDNMLAVERAKKLYQKNFNGIKRCNQFEKLSKNLDIQFKHVYAYKPNTNIHFLGNNTADKLAKQVWRKG